MKNIIFPIFLLMMITACAQNKTNGETIAATVSLSEWEEKMKNEPGTILDVRTAEECAEGIIGDAINMDVNGSDFEKQIESLDKNKPVYVYCRSGKRGTTAMNIMNEKGFKKIYNLEGGILAWKEAKSK